MPRHYLELGRDAGDYVPAPFRPDADTGELPAGAMRADRFPDYVQVIDRDGEKFRKMGPGPVQGTVTLRDRHGRHFFADADTALRPAAWGKRPAGAAPAARKAAPGDMGPGSGYAVAPFGDGSGA